jgi:AcrR family transcriptional regulator
MDHKETRKLPYHHGDLRRAILDAAERRLLAGGLEAVTIRACARDAGVSSAAPIHHFGSLKGLNSALAALGFDRLVARLDAEMKGKDDRRQDSILIGAYVGFAVDSPRLFDLMWRDDILDPADAALLHSRQRALDRLRRLSAEGKDARHATLAAIRIWSLSHGLATLLRHGRIVTALGDTAIGLATEKDFAALAYSQDFLGKQSE